MAKSDEYEVVVDQSKEARALSEASPTSPKPGSPAATYVGVAVLTLAVGAAAFVGAGYLGYVQLPWMGPPAYQRASDAPALHYYMYRVQNDEDYSPENQNMANIPGALWYLHNEIVWHHWLRAGTFASTPKTRIERFLVFSRASQELYDKGMNLGVVNTYDLGKCSGPFKCENLQEYGPVVGCETWDVKQDNNFPHGQWVGKNVYPNAMWYSLPGKCSSKKFWDQQGTCSEKEPSGACPLGILPTGAWDCTYTYQKVGELNISYVEGIKSFSELIEGGGREYDRAKDEGVHVHFWDGIDDVDACQRRIDIVNKLFQKKYPEQPILDDPVCDFKVHEFYPYWPDGGFVKPTPKPNSTEATNASNASAVSNTIDKSAKPPVEEKKK